MTRRKVSKLVLPLLLGFAACSDGTFATEPGESILVPALTGFTAYSIGGGFGYPPAPTGAACRSDAWSYTVALDAATLAWDYCAVFGTGTEVADYARVMSSRALSASELETAKAAARAVRVSVGSSCGADKATWMLRVSAGAETMLYGDEFYACLEQVPHYVTGLDGLYAALQPMAR